MGVGAEAFLIDSPDDKINSLIIDPSKVIFGSLGVELGAPAPTSSLAEVHRFQWKRWFTKQAFALARNISTEMVEALTLGIFLIVSFVRYANVRPCPLTAATLVPWYP